VPDGALIGYLDDGNWSACFGVSLRDLCLFDAAGPQRIIRPGGGELRKTVGAMGLASGRNDLCRRFLDEHDADWLFMVDTDMGFQPDIVERLIASADAGTRPVMGGLCFAAVRVRPAAGIHPLHAERFRIQPTVYAFVTDENNAGVVPILDYPRDSVVQVDATGAACLLIHRTALEKVRAKDGDRWFDLMVHPTGDKGRPRTFSEDLSFCVRLRSCDIPVHVDTGAHTTHDKGFIFLDEETFDQQMALAGLLQEMAKA
jgi:hypothetical protein